MRRYLFALARPLTLVAALAVVPAAATAQAIDCAGALVDARESIDRAAGNLSGMAAQMAAEQLDSVIAMLEVAGNYLGEAEASCSAAQATLYDLAQGVAQASAARGYAEAADMLHFAYMSDMSDMSGMPGMQDMPGGM